MSNYVWLTKQRMYLKGFIDGNLNKNNNKYRRAFKQLDEIEKQLEDIEEVTNSNNQEEKAKTQTK